MISAALAGVSAKPRSQVRPNKGESSGWATAVYDPVSVRRWKSSSARSSWLSSALWEIAPSWWMSHRSSSSTASKSSASTPLSRRPSPSSPTSPPPPAPPPGPRPSTPPSCRRPGRETCMRRRGLFFSSFFCGAACMQEKHVCLPRSHHLTSSPSPSFSLPAKSMVRTKSVYYGHAPAVAKVTSALSQPASREWQCPLAARPLTLVCTADQCAEVSQKTHNYSFISDRSGYSELLLW